MGISLHQTAANDTVLKKFREDPNWAIVLTDYLEGMHKRQWSPDYMDAIFQEAYTVNLGDAYCFAQVHALICTGDIVVTQVDMGCAPFADSDIKRNNQAFQKMPYPFEGEFYGGLGDNDGWVRWTEAIQAENIATKEMSMMPPRQVPLEVGSTKASRTLMHLAESRAIARWPYEQEYLWIFQLVNDALFVGHKV